MSAMHIYIPCRSKEIHFSLPPLRSSSLSDLVNGEQEDSDIEISESLLIPTAHNKRSNSFSKFNSRPLRTECLLERCQELNMLPELILYSVCKLKLHVESYKVFHKFSVSRTGSRKIIRVFTLKIYICSKNLNHEFCYILESKIELTLVEKKCTCNNLYKIIFSMK